MNTINDKRELMLAYGQTVRETPGEPTIEERKLSLALILEELYELAQAYGLEDSFQRMMKQKAANEQQSSQQAWVEGRGFLITDTYDYNAVATLDALADLRVTCDGPILSSGLQHVFPEAMRRVHASNMSKLADSERRLAIDLRSYQERGVNATFRQNPDGRFVLLREDGKVLKSTGYTPVDLTDLI